MGHEEISPAYRAHQAQVKENLEPVRKRPGMYIGSTEARGLHHMVYEVVDNCVAEARAGYGTHIAVTIEPDNSIVVEDNGRGIPIEIDPITGISSVDLVMGEMKNWRQRGEGSQRLKAGGGLHRAGVAVVNALSSYLLVEVHRDGTLCRQHYARSVPQGSLMQVGDTNRTGTRIQFLPDWDVMCMECHFEILDERFRELACLNGGLRFTFRDERPGRIQEHRFSFDDGIASLLRSLNRNRWTPLLDPITIAGEFEEGVVEVALQYSSSTHDKVEVIACYANDIATPNGGTHLTGFRSAVTRAINQYARQAGILAVTHQNLTGKAVATGRTAVVSVRLDHPEFTGSTKTTLGNTQVLSQVERVVKQGLLAYFNEHPEQAHAIVEHCIAAQAS